MAVNRLRLRLFVAAVLLSVSAAYTVGVVSGAVTGEKKIDAVHLALLALTTILCVVVVRPESLERLRLFEIGGVRLEMLEKVREKQHEQESELEDIRLMLPLLLPERERSHLVNLADGKTQYKANANVRGELRRLRYVGLIVMEPGRWIAELKDGVEFDLNEYVSLSELGQRWVQRIRQIDAAEETPPKD